THVLVQRAEERFNLSGNVYGTSHPCGGLMCRNRVADGIPPEPRWAPQRPSIHCNSRCSTSGRNSYHPSARPALGQLTCPFQTPSPRCPSLPTCPRLPVLP